MKIEYILESGSGNLNEDTMVMGKNLFGVFDGATSLDNKIFEHGKTGGLIASSTASSIFSKNCQSLINLAKEANRAIYNKMICNGVNISKKGSLWSTSAAVIRIKNDKLEWVQTGDCFIVLIYMDYSYNVLVKKKNHDYETLTMWKMANKDFFTVSDNNVTGRNVQNKTDADKIGICKTFKDKPQISEALMAQIRKTRAGMNKDYGVLNGEKKAENFLDHGFESLNRVRDILLFTDGLSIPGKNPEKSKKFSGLIDDYLNLGLHGLKNKIRYIEKKDPDCVLYPRFKCHDDIAAISIKNF